MLETLSQIWICFCLHLCLCKPKLGTAGYGYCRPKSAAGNWVSWVFQVDGHKRDRVLVGVEWAYDGYQAQGQALSKWYARVWTHLRGGIPCKFLFWVFQFRIEGFSTTGYRSWIVVGLVDVLRRRPDPKWYTHVWSLLRGYPLQNFTLHFSFWNWKKISMKEESVLVIKPGQALDPSDMPMSEPI